MIDPPSALITFLALLAYLRGARRLGPCALPVRRRVAFAGGLLVLCCALAPALEREADKRFSVHMAQHMVLLLVAPPLLVYGRGMLAFFVAASPDTRRVLRHANSWVRPLARLARHPAFVWVLYTGGVWAWHLPGAYQAALRSSATHLLEHATFLGVALLFWSSIAGGSTRRRTGYVVAGTLAFAAMLPSVWLAMLLSFAPRVLYPAYGTGPAALTDQELAGAIMWAPMAIVTMVVVGVLIARWIRTVDAQHPPRGVLATSTGTD